MAKIILTLGDVTLREMPLMKARLTIGRGPHNDIVIDDRAISAEHAAIVTGDHDSFLEDLNSTNGTQVNGQPVRQHFLQDGDVVELAGYRMLYTATGDDGKEDTGYSATETLSGRAGSEKGFALLRILNGPNAGKETTLTKTLTTIGRPQEQVAVIARRPQGYYLMHIEGNDELSVNGKSLGKGELQLGNSDVIDLSGTQMQFCLTNFHPMRQKLSVK